MSQLQVFTNSELGQVRTVKQGEDIWFVAKDVCEALGYINPTMAMKRIDEDERAKLNLGRQGDTNCVNESGLYSLIMTSRKPQAKAFKKWVTSEVLPAIRKDGGYVVAHEEEDETTILARALLVAQSAIDRKNKPYSPTVSFHPL
ncbi:BRO-N domain-containing protein [Bacillus hominis]|uniref:BRO-N domain-containing protein n=1 Tax=Bacillus hominis TaxID=2817478 RepID=UPI003DA6798F